MTIERRNTGTASAKAKPTFRRWAATSSSLVRRASSAGTSSLAPNPARSTAAMQAVRSWSVVAASKVMIAFSSGRLTLTAATPSTLDSTRSTEATHAAQDMPVTLRESWRSSMMLTLVAAAFPFLPGFVHADATATAGAQPAHALPSFSAFCTGVEAFHLASTGAPLSDDACHGSSNNVVNINPPF